MRKFRDVFLLTSSIVFFIFCYTFGQQNSETKDLFEKSYSTSIFSMIDLLDIEQKLVQNLDSYANDLQLKLQIVRLALKKMRYRLAKAENDPEIYLSNPVNSFQFIRHMQADWTAWQQVMKDNIGKAYLDAFYQYQKDLPTKKDLIEAIRSIYRIQKVYQLKSEDIANGLLNGKQYDTKLGALDCFAIAEHYYNNEDYFDAVPWFKRALSLYTDKHSRVELVMGMKCYRIYELYVNTLLKLGRRKNALKVIYEALLHSNDTSLLNLKMKIMEDMELPVKPLKRNNKRNSFQYRKYLRGCRGKFPPLIDSALVCRYNTTTTPFLRLAPLKMEELSIQPYVVLYHDVLYDREIDYFKTKSKGYLNRTETYDVKTKNNSPDDERTAKGIWIQHNLSNYTNLVEQRIADMTGLNLYDAELLHLINYGLGGHYDIHFDAFNDENEIDDRLATVFFYFNDVEQGGATVFPHLNIAVKPRKGMALIWYNLHDSGIFYEQMLHAACPVIVGSKWAMSKWIYYLPQFYANPCYNKLN